MKLNIKNKKVIILSIVIPVILIVKIIVGINLYKIIDAWINYAIEENAYIKIYRDNSRDSDICLYGIGSGINLKLYLGNQTTHYLIYKNGDVYTHRNSSYKHAITGIREPADIEYIKTLSSSELKELENDLKLIIKNDKSNSIRPEFNEEHWYIKMNDNITKVNVNVGEDVLDNYF